MPRLGGNEGGGGFGDSGVLPVVRPVVDENAEADVLAEAVDSSESLRCSDGSADGLRGRAGGVFLDGSGGGALACFPVPF